MNAAQLDEGGFVINVIVVDTLDVIPGLIDGTGAAIGDQWDGSQFVKPTPVPSLPTEAEYVGAIQSLLDATAQTRRYDGILSACSYAGSEVAKFSAEGTACRNWRDAVWATSYDLLAQVEAGTLAQPTVADLLAMLPAMTWPA